MSTAPDPRPAAPGAAARTTGPEARDAARRAEHGPAWADAVAQIAAEAPRRLTPDQARVVKRELHPTRRKATP